MPKSVVLGEFEHIVLLVVLELRDDAYAVALRRRLNDVAGRTVSRGALYRTLDRLGGKGYVTWSVEDGGPARGGHPRRRYAVTEAGVAALREARATFVDLWNAVGEALR